MRRRYVTGDLFENASSFFRFKTHRMYLQERVRVSESRLNIFLAQTIGDKFINA